MIPLTWCLSFFGLLFLAEEFNYGMARQGGPSVLRRFLFALLFSIAKA